MEGFVMLNYFSASKKMEKKLSKGERCKAVLVNAPTKFSKYIGKEVKAYIFEDQLFLNCEDHVIRTSEIENKEPEGDILHVITSNSEYALRVF